MKRILLLTILISSTLAGFGQQDPEYNQYMFNLLGVNPAYAGAREVLSTALLYRNQWVGFEGAPKTQTFSLNAPLKQKKIGLGFQVTNDEIGPKRTISADLSYAYRIRAFGGKLSFGLRSGFYHYRFDWNQIDYKDEGDVVPILGASTLTVPNFDFGLFYNTNTFYTGIELTHLNQPKLSILDTSINGNNSFQFRHITAIVGKAFVLNENVSLRPSVLFKQAGATTGFVDLNFNVLFNEVFWAGIAYRPTYGIIAILEYDFLKKYRLGYSFDYPTNQLSNKNAGTHEIFLGIDFDIARSKAESPRLFYF